MLRLELAKWADGSVRLTHWNSDTGEDTVIILVKGKKPLISQDYDCGEEILLVCDDLSDFLIGLLEERG